MTVFDGARNRDEPLPLYLDILGAAVWFACFIGWTALVLAIGVLMQ